VNAWAFFDVETGERLGQHVFDANGYASLGESVALDVNDDQREDLIRFDRAVEPSDPDDRCPAREVLPRLVTAVDGATYETLWQTALRPADPCRGATSERVNVVTLNGAPAILVTESNSIRRLEPATGLELDRADIDDLPSSNRGGGWMLSTGLDAPAFLRVGGNGPIEARDAELELVWRAADDLAPGPRSWLGRPAVVVGRQVWISPAPGFAAVQLGLDGPTTGQVEGTIRLGGGRRAGAGRPGTGGAVDLAARAHAERPGGTPVCWSTVRTASSTRCARTAPWSSPAPTPTPPAGPWWPTWTPTACPSWSPPSPTAP
jgi:hypothetical protein